MICSSSIFSRSRADRRLLIHQFYDAMVVMVVDYLLLFIDRLTGHCTIGIWVASQESPDPIMKVEVR